MRIRSLRLLAFGPFTGRELTLAGDDVPANALQVVFGPNEAGKSTALRAIGGLLFGIPVQTRDAHHHRMADLRVGGVLQAADGTVLEVVRRKGQKNTLLDRDGNALDEAALRRLCGAATEATFGALFGLDHVSLREGAEALLAGKGDLGESLYDAALGHGRGIHRVLEALEAEAEALFTPQAQKRKLNEAIKAYQEARGEARLKARSGEAWQVQTRSLEEARAEQERLSGALRARKRELHGIERARRLAPLAARRERLTERRTALGAVVLLSPDAPQARAAAQLERGKAEAELARLDGEIADANRRRSALLVPGWLDEPAALRLAELPDRLGAHRKAAEDRPRLVGAMAALEAEVQAMTARLRAAPPLPGAPAATSAGTVAFMSALTVAAQARVRALALSEGALAQACAQAARAEADTKRRRAARAETLAQQPARRDVRGLRALLRRIEREGDLQGRLQAALHDRARLQGELERRVSALGLRGGGVGGDLRLSALPVPPAEVVERFAKELQALSGRQDLLDNERRTLERRRAEIDRQLRALERGGEVPSEVAVARTRGVRSEAWARLRRSLSAEPGAAAEDRESLVAAYERAVAGADEAADRLWRDAERFARARALGTEASELEAASAQAEKQQADLTQRRDQTLATWQETWRPLGVVARGPEEMRAWLRRFEDAAALADRVGEADERAQTLGEQVRRAQDELGRLLAEAGGPPGSLDDLPALLERAAGFAAEVEEANRRSDALARELADLDEEVLSAGRARAEAEASMATWRCAWAEAIAPLGLGAQATAAEATAVLDAAGALSRKQDDLLQLRRRVDAIDRDTRRFDESVAALAEALAPEFEGPSADVAERLLARHREGLQARREAEALDQELRRRGEARAAAEARRADADARLDALLVAAQVTDVAALEEAERRSSEALGLGQQLADIDDQILAAAEGLGLEAALAEARRAAVEDLDARAAGLREEIEALEGDLQRANVKLGSVAAGLRLLEESGAAEAAEAAALAQAHLARVRGLAEQYARLRLGAHLLATEIERYREQNQGPVLARAGVLLSRLTLGRYTGLRADFDESDHPVLRCVRADGARVPVDGLSDGTRDQLYLALRLATLERQTATAEPLPLVLDDILIHFDDERAGAALEVLAEHARSTQVLLFTHHARVVDLAERRVPADRLHVVRLAG